MTVYSMVEVVGTSGTSVSDAIEGALERASASYDGLSWFEVKEIRGAIGADRTPEYQVRLAVGLALKAPERPRDEGSTARKAGARATRSREAQVAAKAGERKRTDLARGFEKQGKTR